MPTHIRNIERIKTPGSEWMFEVSEWGKTASKHAFPVCYVKKDLTSDDNFE